MNSAAGGGFRRAGLLRLGALLGLLMLGTQFVGCAGPSGPSGPAERSATAAPRESRPPAEAGNPERRAQARLELAELYFGRGQFAVALDEVNVALSVKPDLAAGHGLRGLILASMGDPRAAEESFLRAIQLTPGDGSPLHNYGWFLCQQRRFADSEKQFMAALAMPQYRDATRSLLAQGVCQARAGRWAEAERTLSRSFELDPANPITAFNLSEVLLRRGEFERARFYVRRINVVPELVSAQSLWLAARVDRRLGNVDGLRELSQQLRERFPQSPEALRLERGKFDD